jgi:hypothetical protein
MIMTEVGYPCTPAISTRLENLGKRLLIAVNENGGMGGGCAKLVGEVSEMNDNLIHVRLTESNRTMTVNMAWVSYMEDVTLYKRTHIHDNPNFENKTRIDYMVSKGNEQIVLVKGIVNDELKHSKLCIYVDGDKC